MPKEKKCRWCGKPQKQCYIHCHQAKDGKHVPDGLSAQQADGIEFIVDYTCEKCGVTGGAEVKPGDIYWG